MPARTSAALLALIVRSFPEIDRAEWFPLAEARHKLMSGQVPILTALADVLQ